MPGLRPTGVRSTDQAKRFESADLKGPVGQRQDSASLVCCRFRTNADGAACVTLGGSTHGPAPKIPRKPNHYECSFARYGGGALFSKTRSRGFECSLPRSLPRAEFRMASGFTSNRLLTSSVKARLFMAADDPSLANVQPNRAREQGCGPSIPTIVRTVACDTHSSRAAWAGARQSAHGPLVAICRATRSRRRSPRSACPGDRT
jgi:hypothetical protein